METKNQKNADSFVCCNCKNENFYDPSDFIDRSRSNELLLEMIIYKYKQVIIHCNNPKCRTQNSVTIRYI